MRGQDQDRTWLGQCFAKNRNRECETDMVNQDRDGGQGPPGRGGVHQLTLHSPGTAHSNIGEPCAGEGTSEQDESERTWRRST